MGEERSFIEVQFPVSKISKESYKERKANYSQTLTGLGKWWGRKPLVLVRAALLGALMPVSENPIRDREIFLQIMTMDNEGLRQRKKKSFTAKEIFECLDAVEKRKWFDPHSTVDKPKANKWSAEEKNALQDLVFSRLSYDEKLEYCDRPENVTGPVQNTWQSINSHLGTAAQSIAELINELGTRRFGHTPIVGDSFCGGGSVPFEAARIGCEAFGSDLNPVSAVLTWAGIHILGGGQDTTQNVVEVKRKIYEAVDSQYSEWGIELNKQGWRADAFLYCAEIVCPDCGWHVPMLPTFVIGENTRTTLRLKENSSRKRFEIIVTEGCSVDEMALAKKSGTVRDSSLVCPNVKCAGHVTPISLTRLRSDRCDNNCDENGLRQWNNEDLVPRDEDVFGERLYCIRWIETIQEDNRSKQFKHYLSPDDFDLAQEEKVLLLLRERFEGWQQKGYVPSRKIESGYNTDQPIRERGWTHWHHLFNPRQLLMNGLFFEKSMAIAERQTEIIGALLGIGKIADWNSRLCRWDSSLGNEKVAQTFYNQALNTMSTYATKGILGYCSSWLTDIKPDPSLMNISAAHHIVACDARDVKIEADIWMTDPPYADAVNYHELSEFFLAWYERQLPRAFPDWYSDSKRALAITGSSATFRKSMAECYKNLAFHMPNNGLQIVMFTHQDASVWADLALILWSAGLRVTAAWCIATETNSSMKQGNYVQGTVLLVLRKQTSTDTAFLDEVYPQVDAEVINQLAEMTALDDKEDPNFGDTDYQLAAYAAALRVLTRYHRIEEIDVQRELVKVRAKGETSPLEAVIREAVKIACNYQIPTGLDKEVWRGLSADERFYIKGLELESHGEYRTGAYQEFAKGFGIREYNFMLSSGKANQARLKTASEFGGRNLGGEGFASSLTRHALYAVRETANSGETIDGRNWFRNELGARYWSERKNLTGILSYFAGFAHSANMPQWTKDADAAKLLAVAVENDHV